MKIGRRTLIWSARIVLAAVFLYAGFVKLESEEFALTMARFSMLPDGSSVWIAKVLPAVEILAGGLLLIPQTARAAAGVIALLLVGFIAALTWAISENLVLDCGCFGEDESVPSRAKMLVAIGRDVGLLALTLGLAARRSRGGH